MHIIFESVIYFVSIHIPCCKSILQVVFQGLEVKGLKSVGADIWDKH